MVKPDLKPLPILLGAVVCIIFHFSLNGHYNPLDTGNTSIYLLLLSASYLLGGFIAGGTARYRGTTHGFIAAGVAGFSVAIFLYSVRYSEFGYLDTGVIAAIVSILIVVAFEGGVGALGGTLGLLFINRKHLKRHYLRTLIIRTVVTGIFAVICLALLMTLCSAPF